MEKREIISYFDKSAKTRDYWRKRNWYYHRELEKFFKFIIPENSSVLEIGCGTDDLLANLRPQNGTGIDISKEMIKIAKEKYPQLEFIIDDIENPSLNRKFDYVIMQDLIGILTDVWLGFRNLTQLHEKIVKLHVFLNL